jgi:hypothetical protein
VTRFQDVEATSRPIADNALQTDHPHRLPACNIRLDRSHHGSNIPRSPLCDLDTNPDALVADLRYNPGAETGDYEPQHELQLSWSKGVFQGLCQFSRDVQIINSKTVGVQ